MDFFQALVGFVIRPSNSRTLGILVILILVSSIFLTVTATQQQQTIKQRAAGITKVNKIGDVNNDNTLDIKDYNEIAINCFEAKKETSACSYKIEADLNKDGEIDGIDLNIFLTNLKNN